MTKDFNRVAVLLMIDTTDVERVERFVKNLKERNEEIGTADIMPYDDRFGSPVIYIP